MGGKKEPEGKSIWLQNDGKKNVWNVIKKSSRSKNL